MCLKGVKMVNLNKFRYENDKIKIQLLNSREKIRELVKNMKNISTKSQRNKIQKNFEILLGFGRVLVIKDKKNKMLADMLVGPLKEDESSISFMIGTHVNNITTNQYKEVVKFLYNSIKIQNNAEIVAIAIHQEQIIALKDLGFYQINLNKIDKFFDEKAFTVTLLSFDVKAFMSKT